MIGHIFKKPMGILFDALFNVEKFILPEDFVSFNYDCKVNFEMLIILERPFLANSRVLVDMEWGKLKFRLNNEEVMFNICRL